jgi:hypothetical protein
MVGRLLTNRQVVKRDGANYELLREADTAGSARAQESGSTGDEAPATLAGRFDTHRLE